MIILVINSGSSSIKYQLYKMPEKKVLAKGLIEKIGEPNSNIKNHKEGLNNIVSSLTDKDNGVIKSMDEIAAVGHRVVHGGENYSSSVLIDDKVVATIKECADLAPLHNPPNLAGIEVSRSLMPKIPNIAVFDTAFHQTLPPEAYHYAIPYELYEKYKIRRYGFHGSSHAYVANRAAELLGKNKEDINIITCHLGNGASMAAVKKGKSIDTTMGLTPLEGLVMGTRSGDLDPAIIFYLLRKGECSNIDEVDKLLNKKSGLLGVSGFSNDMRNLEEAAQGGNHAKRAKLALNLFANRLKKYIGAYMATLGSTDAIVFTGGIGENADLTRKDALKDLDSLGIVLDETKNKEIIRGKEGDISQPSSKVKILVIPTDEEGFIATETFNLC